MDEFRDTDFGNSSGDLFAAIAAHYPLRQARVLLLRPPMLSKWSLKERRNADGKRCLQFCFSGGEFPELKDWYEPLQAAFAEIYVGRPQPRGEP